MITADFIWLLLITIVIGLCAIGLLAYGIYIALTESEMSFCVGMIVSFLCLSAMSGFIFMASYNKYQDAIPQNHVNILRQKISDAEKELQKYLIDHPELKEIEQ